MPLNPVGGDPALRALGANFAAIVAENVTAGDVRGMESPALAAVPADARARAAARQSAGAVIDGTLLAIGPVVRATVRLTQTRGGRVLTTTTVEGPRDSLLPMADRASVALLKEWWRVQPGSRLRSGIVTSSLPALRHYVHAMGEWGRGSPWRVLLDSAVRYDPGFLAAWTWLSVPAADQPLADFVGAFGSMGEAAARARGIITPDSASRTLRLVASRQPAADRQETGRLPYAESVAPLAAASIAPPSVGFERMQFCQPSFRQPEIELLYLDALRARLATLAGCPDSVALALARTAFEADSSFAPARRLLISASIDAADTAAARRLLDRSPTQDTLWLKVQRRLLAARLAPPALDNEGLFLLLERWHRFRDLADALPALKAWLARQPQVSSVSGADQALGMVLEAPLYYAMGRRDTAAFILRASMRGVTSATMGSPTTLSRSQAWLMLGSFPSPAPDSLFYPAALDTTQLAQMIGQFAASAHRNASGALGPAIRMFTNVIARAAWTNGLFALERGDRVSAARFSALLDSLAQGDSSLTRALALGFSGDIALAAGQADTAVLRFNRAVSVSVTTTPTRYRWLLARHYAATGHPDLALRLARTITMPSMQHGTDNVGYYAQALKLEGEVLEGLGRRAEAAARYREYIDLRRDADAAFQPEVADARVRLARLGTP